MCRRLIYLILLALGLSGVVANAQNQINNWEFDTQLDPLSDGWFRWEGGNFNSISIVEGAGLSGQYAMKIDIGGGSLDPLQVFHGFLKLEQGATYTISFMAKADAPRTTTVQLQARATHGWQVYWQEASLQLTTEPQTFTFEYTHTGATVGGTGVFDDDIDLHWLLVGDGTDLYLDRVWMGEGAPPSPVKAISPDPPHGSIYEDKWANLKWEAGNHAVSHDIYIGTDFDDVSNGTGGTFWDNQDVTWLIIGWPGCPIPDGLVPGTTYYWRIDEVNDLHPDSPWKGDVWSFTVPSKKAYGPLPADGAKFVDPDVVLAWSKGYGAAIHRVYFGEDYDTVKDATGAPFYGLETYDPPVTLEYDKTYYWRIDEVEADGITVHTGDVWSFTITPEGGGIKGAYYHWSGSSPPTPPSSAFAEHVMTRIDPGINFSWGTSPEPNVVNEDNFAVVWTGELEVGFAEPYTFYTVSDDGVMLWVDGQLLVDNWTDHGAAEDRATSALDLVPGQRYPVVMHLYENGGSAVARLLWESPSTPKQIIPTGALLPPRSASSPVPAHGATNVTDTPTLQWSAGDKAVQHDVYFGTDQNAVANADTTTAGVYRGRQALALTSYVPSESPLEWDTTYYWRVDEVNGVDLWKGSVWSFTTANYMVVDDFEPYDDFCNRIFYTWEEGGGYGANVDCGVLPSAGNGTGSLGGYAVAPYAEQTIVHGGDQSMPMEYLNDGSYGNALYSEIERTFDPPQDWTIKGVKALSLWFRGLPGSVGSFNYNPVGDIYTMTADGWDISGTDDGFHYAFKRLSGVGSIQAQVLSVQNTNEWAKAGVMIREDLDPNSAHAMTFVTPSNGVVFEYRPSKGADNVGAAGQQTGITAPHWVRISRSGNTFTSEQSADGSNWTTLGTPQSVPMGATVYVGLAVTSHDEALTCQATFSDVTITGTVTGQWQSQDIGITSNDAERLYVALEDSTGTVKDAPHPDPNAVQLDTWQEWNIDLAAFAPVDLTKVKKIYIGVGNRNLPTLGGSGMLYIDDIGLYMPRCFPALAKPAGDFNNNCVVDYPDLQVLAGEWLAEKAELGQWDRVAYWDGDYPFAWGGDGIAMRDALAAAGYTILGADELKTWMDARIADGKTSVAVFCLDIVPETVAETMDTDCTLRKYLDAGGKIVWYADWPFYYVGHPDGSQTTWGDAGASAILGFNASSGPNDSYDVVVFTPAGISWGLTETWQSRRPTSATITTDLTVLATTSAGSAAAWAKHYVPRDIGRGFVRLWDTTGTPPAADVMRVAESNGALAADLNGDGTVDFKDYAVLVDMWLEEVLWP